MVLGVGALVGLGHDASAGTEARRTGPLVNVALTGSVTADSAADAHPATAAADGDGTTTWCPAGASGTLTVDLGRKAQISGFGVTLLDGSGTVTISTAARPGRFHVVQRQRAVSDGVPAWLTGSADARWVRLEVSGGCVGELRVLAPGRPTMQGGDMSFAVQEAAAGAVYSDRGRVALPEQILAAHGSNWVRLRVWVDPPVGYSDLPSVLAMARRAKAAGMRLLLDPHYSDFWADPQHQDTPAAWADQDLPTLAQTVRTYTSDVLDALAAQGTPVDMLQLGNEIRNGLLWPTGYIDWSADPGGTGWDNLGTLLRAMVDGARDSSGPMPRLLVHFDQGGDNAWSRTFYDHIVAQDVPFDVIGLSYYPFWHGTLSQLRANMNDMAARYDKDVVIAETQYGWTLENGDSLGNFLWQASQLVPGYPASPNGQLTFLSDLASIVDAVPGGRGIGIFYWSPEWIPGVGWAPGEGTPNDNLTLFGFTGDALAAVGYADPVRSCRLYACA